MPLAGRQTASGTRARGVSRPAISVADNPSLGRECAEVRPDYRKYPSGSHVLFYRLTDDGIDVVRILHERMDYKRHIP